MLLDLPTVDKKLLRHGYLAPIPDTGWRPITEFPVHYANACRIAYDVETRDPELITTGAGWGKGIGYIVGIALAAQFHDGHIESVYLPIKHDVHREYNLDEQNTLRFVKYVLETNIPKFGANLYYDFGWLTEVGIFPQGAHYDVQYAEALLSNAGEVNLEFLGNKYCGIGKTTDYLYDWIRATFPQTKESKLRQHIWQSPPELVGHYAEQDAVLPLKIIEEQWKILYGNQLLDVFNVECGLIPLLVHMRRQGISVNIDATSRLVDDLRAEIEQDEKLLWRDTGSVFNVDSALEIGAACDKLGLKYPRTPTGSPSFVKDWLKEADHPMFQKIIEIREKKKCCGTFLEGFFLNSAVNGKVHPSFHPLRSDDGGTRTGRFSSSQPNFQQIPSRTNLGQRVRELVVPDYGHATMFCGDYSQIEYRTLAHFAVGVGADEVRRRYISDPNTDYHDLTIALVKEITGKEIKRSYIKNINFGLLYGMSPKKLAISLGLSLAEAMILFDAYHAAAPYVKATMNSIAEEAGELGYVRTMLGRMSYFDSWVRIGDKDCTPLPYDLAVAHYGHYIERTALYKATNYKIQGSAADIMKVAMLRGWQDGVFNETTIPRITVHDELLWSVPERTPRVDEAFAEFVNIAETCMPYSVPIKFEAGYGSTWGEAK